MRAHGKRHHAGQDGAGLSSGITEKSKIGNDLASCGMTAKGKNQLPTGNPSKKIPGGHVMK